MRAFCCHGNQSFDPICPETLCGLSPTLMMLHIKFDQDWPTGLRDIQVSSELWRKDGMTEWQSDRMTRGQGKSSIAPTFSKRGYKKVLSIYFNLILLGYTGWYRNTLAISDHFPRRRSLFSNNISNILDRFPSEVSLRYLRVNSPYLSLVSYHNAFRQMYASIVGTWPPPCFLRDLHVLHMCGSGRLNTWCNGKDWIYPNV